jgi:hypothetical protein
VSSEMMTVICKAERIRFCNSVYVHQNVIDFLSNPVNHDFVEFMVNRRHSFCGYTCHTEDCTFCCDETRHVYLFDGHPIFVDQGSTFAYEMSMGSSGMCMISNSNLRMFVTSAREEAIRVGFDISKVVFPQSVLERPQSIFDKLR